MKRIAVLITLLFIGMLTACTSPVTIKPDVVEVVFDNPRYNGDEIVVDVWITNGQSNDADIRVVDFWFELPEGTDWTGLDSNEVCGAQFDIFEVVKAGSYKEYELTFTSEFVSLSEEDLTALGLSLDDLEFYYLINPSTT